MPREKVSMRYYSNREAREVAQAAIGLAPLYGGKVEPLAELDAGGGQVIVICRGGRIIVGFPSNGIYVPALTDAQAMDALRRYVVVDQGAVRHVVNGANVMRPGITEYTDFSSGDAVSVREPNYKKPIAVGLALAASSELLSMSKGPVVRNIHHLRDGAWELLNDADVRGAIEKASRG